jgi:hypothetical protein
MLLIYKLNKGLRNTNFCQRNVSNGSKVDRFEEMLTSVLKVLQIIFTFIKGVFKELTPSIKSVFKFLVTSALISKTLVGAPALAIFLPKALLPFLSDYSCLVESLTTYVRSIAKDIVEYGKDNNKTSVDNKYLNVRLEQLTEELQQIKGARSITEKLLQDEITTLRISNDFEKEKVNRLAVDNTVLVKELNTTHTLSDLDKLLKIGGILGNTAGLGVQVIGGVITLVRAYRNGWGSFFGIDASNSEKETALKLEQILTTLRHAQQSSTNVRAARRSEQASSNSTIDQSTSRHISFDEMDNAQGSSSNASSGNTD